MKKTINEFKCDLRELSLKGDAHNERSKLTIRNKQLICLRGC